MNARYITLSLTESIKDTIMGHYVALHIPRSRCEAFLYNLMPVSCLKTNSSDLGLLRRKDPKRVIQDTHTGNS